MAQKQHIVLFPTLCQGHFIPFLALAAHLEQRNRYTITLVSTPLNVKNLQSTLPPTTSIRLASLPFNGLEHGLPPNSESTDTLPCHLPLRLLQVSETLKPSFENLISEITREDGRPPFCIISDMFLGWTVEIAKRLGIFHTVFVVSGAYGTAVYFSLWLNLPHSKTDSDEFPLPDFPEPISIHRSQLTNHLKLANGSDALSQLHQRLLPLCFRSDGFLFNTVEELEKTGLEYFRRKTNRPVWAIGPVKNVSYARKEPGISADRCLSWLNLHCPNSVLYVSFGSQNTISVSQMMELAMGLEASGTPFIWVVRPPVGFDINEEFRAEWLPEGFEERMAEGKRGMLVRNWGPQLEILSHGSTGAFLSHCGWNSTVESLSRGVPLIGWPLSAEQFYNVKMMEEKLGVCVEIARGYGGEIERSEVERVIKEVMGEEMRKKALEVKEMMNDATREDKGSVASSLEALDEFLTTAIRQDGKPNECV
ncbi:UDP-glycosyltransferase 92A1-like [Magnolia sinica]|uniref:UDP-glycosyltransferase 92A1-like n=1 Tax=Magnolia sinica TaxID=86752 RepID=UPI00265A53E1|nr:UDP-glycosyltransferase 92A1-like [Magnolia sinica]